MLIEVSKTIKAARKSAHLTQVQLAKAIGCAPLTISRYECGQRTPSLKILAQIAEVVGVSIADLLGGCDVVYKH
ncbi:MAG: helix-turn-helix transcriptional regulator [bacterium]|nr:helix-turn-helix transcriptional regulator [bacterium]